MLDVTGPEALGAEAQAALIAQITRKPIQGVHVDDEAYANTLRFAREPTAAQPRT